MQQLFRWKDVSHGAKIDCCISLSTLRSQPSDQALAKSTVAYDVHFVWQVVVRNCKTPVFTSVASQSCRHAEESVASNLFMGLAVIPRSLRRWR
jgi:hypothetical protein